MLGLTGVLAAAEDRAHATTQATTPRLALSACRLPDLPQAVQCGWLQRPLDPQRPGGTRIQLRVAVVPAVSRNKAADAVVFLAGGPGQSAIDLAGMLVPRYARLNQRRDLIFIDQRGTGRSAPLACPDDRPNAALLPLADALNDAERQRRLTACRRMLQALPYGDLRFFSTVIASADLDAVRAALGIEQIDLIGASYGTRAALDYQRQFPQRVRRAVLDGVVPPDMRLPDSAARDNQAALDGVLAACAADRAPTLGNASLPGCAQRHPDLAARLLALRERLPVATTLPHPLSGKPEPVQVDADLLAAWLRAPLYVPALASVLPAVLDAALLSPGWANFAPLAALGSALSGSGMQLFSGMHLSVICAEDLGPGAPPTPAADAAAMNDPANAFGTSLARHYARSCADWPRAAVPADFYRLPRATAPTWLLSGGADPVTPPRHAVRVAAALGEAARHRVAAALGHGVLSLDCVRDAAQRFIAADDAAEAWRATETQALSDCIDGAPRPPAYRAIGTTTVTAPASQASR